MLCFPCQKIPYTFVCWASYFPVIDCSLTFIECCILNFYSLIYNNFSHLLMVIISITQDETSVIRTLCRKYLQAVHINKIQLPTMIQKRRNYMFYTHIPLLLTQFHLYQRFTILQETCLNTWELQSSMPSNKAQSKEIRRRPIQISNLDQPLARRQPRPTQKSTRGRRS